ncbi:hypothetical protein AO361_17810 [Pseudomonas fluorescens]|jgi:hypothetical protein|uniref:TniB family NTP-binding protein n=1 Tax=Pseudomonas TaxID=286 RepID=UPI00070DAAC5|nr:MULTISPECIES: TniB family NTP-binding protein [Pseudomonas]OOQ44941.1 hypothetical protein AO361_17810 [Pseudomonas fluorescens]
MIDISKQLETFEAQIINYKAYNLAYMTVMRSIQATQMRGIPSCVVLVGESGCGKSTLAHQIMSTYPSQSTGEDDRGIWNSRPTMYCGLPTKATIKSFAKALLQSLEFEAYSGDAFELTQRALRQILLQKVEVAFLDEFQMLADKKAEQACTDVMNCVARLVDRTGIPFVILGTPDIEGFFYKKGILRRRFPFFARLDPLQLELTDQNSDFQIVLRGLDKKMYEIGQLEKGVHLHEPEIALPLFVASGGILEDIRLHLSNAFSFSLYRGDAILRREDFTYAFEITRHDNCILPAGNPFEVTKNILVEITSGDK